MTLASASKASTAGGGKRTRRWRALTVVHPVPSLINAALVAVIASVAGADAPTALLLAAAMLGFQFSIGALNDLADAPVDGLVKPYKPIPAGQVPRWLAGAVVVLGAALGLFISARFGPLVLLLGALGYGCGVAYDLVLRRAGLAWLGFAVAIPLLLAWTWLAAAGTLPAGWLLLLPLAALAGPALHLANSLVDAPTDERSERVSLATQLGPRLATRVLAVLTAAILLLAWGTLALLAPASPAALAGASAATVAVVLGVAFSMRRTSRAREAGWLLQAIGLALLAAAWLAAMAAA